MALHAELAAGNADQHLVLHHQRRGCAGGALRGVGVLHRPGDLAGRRVQRHQGRVGLVQEDLALAVGDATVHGVAAHDGDDVRILLRLVGPQDAAAVVKIEREHLVGEGCRQVHHVADHERAAFMAAQHAG